MKRYLLTVVAVFCVASIFMYLVMGVLLANEAMALGPVVRPPGEQEFPLLFVSNIITALAFVWIFSVGFEAGKPWVGQGLRFGFAAWLFRPLPVFLINHAMMPFPASCGKADSLYADGAACGWHVRRVMYRTRSGTPTE